MIKVGLCSDAADRNALRTFLAQVQPAEVAYSVSNMPAEVLVLLRRLPCRPQLSPSQSSPDLMAAREELRKYRTAHPGKLTDEVEALLKNDGAAVAAVGAFSCLHGNLLGNRVLPFATWGLLDSLCSSQQATTPGPMPVSAWFSMPLHYLLLRFSRPWKAHTRAHYWHSWTTPTPPPATVS